MVLAKNFKHFTSIDCGKHWYLHNIFVTFLHCNVCPKIKPGYYLRYQLPLVHWFPPWGIIAVAVGVHKLLPQVFTNFCRGCLQTFAVGVYKLLPWVFTYICRTTFAVGVHKLLPSVFINYCRDTYGPPYFSIFRLIFLSSSLVQLYWVFFLLRS